MDLNNYDGQLIFAQPADRSAPVRALVCVGVAGAGALNVVEVGGGILSGQVSKIGISEDYAGGWIILANGDGSDTIGAIVDSMTSMLTNPDLSIEVQARVEARTTREVLLHTLQRNRDRLRVLQRAAEDANLASNRDTEDEVAKEVFAKLLSNPNPEAEQPQQPFSQGSYDDAPAPQIIISVSHQDPEVRDRLSQQIADRLKKKPE